MTSDTPAIAATRAAPVLGRGRFAMSTRRLPDPPCTDALSPACSCLADALRSALLCSACCAGRPPACGAVPKEALALDVGAS